MKKTFIILTLVILSPHLFSQNTSDALRYSQVLYGGTARFQGLAGAMGAVGGDFSVIATNPAGLGIFKSSEISITPSVWISNTLSDYSGTSTTDHKVNFGLGNFGAVFSISPSKNKSTGGIKNFNFAFGINRQNDFNNRIMIRGQNNTSSLLTDWVNVLNSDRYLGPDQYPFDINLAYNANLIYYDTITGQYANDARYPDLGGVYQMKSIVTYGSLNEFDFAFGANYDDKLYFGITIGVPYLRYYESTEYTETKTNENIPFFREMTYQQVLETHGTGINFKAGVIYRPANWVRIGAAIHTPTFYGNMRDSWSSSLYAGFDSVYASNWQDSPLGQYNYLMTTPFRAIGSLAFIVGPYGLISAEYEYDNYGSTRFNDQAGNTGGNYSDLNDLIKSTYTTPLNLRFGTEWRIWDFRIRGGFGYYGSPYKNDINTGDRMLVSGGVGYRGKHVFADLTYVWSKMKDKYYLYDPQFVGPSDNVQRTSSVVMTWGVRF